jgi:hypothetical protein
MSVPSGFNAAVNIIHILADLPDFLREPVLRKKLQEFYIYDESDKRETISTALNAASSIEAKKLNVLVKSWMEVLSELDTGRILTMLTLYCDEILKDRSVLKNLNFDSVVQAFMTLDEVKKVKFIYCLKEAMFSVPNRHKIIQMLPITAREILEIK